MNVYVKVALSGAGVFLGGMTSYYQVHASDTLHWLPLVMAGLTPLAGYLVGLYQTNAGLPGGSKP